MSDTLDPVSYSLLWTGYYLIKSRPESARGEVDARSGGDEAVRGFSKVRVDRRSRYSSNYSAQRRGRDRESQLKLITFVYIHTEIHTHVSTRGRRVTDRPCCNMYSVPQVLLFNRASDGSPSELHDISYTDRRKPKD